jgi:hypothetical protein
VRCQLIGPHAPAVHIQRDRADSGVGQDAAVERQAVRLDRERPGQHPAAEQQPQRVRDPGTDHDLVR